MIIKVEKGTAGWGGPLHLRKDGKRNKILSLCAGGIHDVSLKLGELLGCEVVDGFKSGLADEEVVVAVIDCGGTARCGVYPKKKIPTINVNPVGKSGPLAQFITEEYYVSDVSVANLLADSEFVALIKSDVGASAGAIKKPENYNKIKKNAQERYQKKSLVVKVGTAMGRVMSTFYEAGRETIDMVISNILPFMGFISMIIGIILASGIGDFIAHAISPMAGTFLGLLVISIVCSIPILSPVLGPGAVIAQVVGVLVGTQIGMGAIEPFLALPALFAINSQVGCDFIPVGLSLGEADPETVELGMPAILYSRMITGPLSVVVAYVVALFVLR